MDSCQSNWNLQYPMSDELILAMSMRVCVRAVCVRVDDVVIAQICTHTQCTNRSPGGAHVQNSTLNADPFQMRMKSILINLIYVHLW